MNKNFAFRHLALNIDANLLVSFAHNLYHSVLEAVHKMKHVKSLLKLALLARKLSASLKTLVSLVLKHLKFVTLIVLKVQCAKYPHTLALLVVALIVSQLMGQMKVLTEKKVVSITTITITITIMLIMLIMLIIVAIITTITTTNKMMMNMVITMVVMSRAIMNITITTNIIKVVSTKIV